jgi:hypothetical protein
MFTKVPFSAKLLWEEGSALLWEEGSALLWAKNDEGFIFSYKPNANYIENIEFATDVIKTKTTEQRICLRKNARVTFDFDVYFNESNFREIKAIMRSIDKQSFVYPDWVSGTYVGNVLASDTEINFDTTEGSYVVGNLLAIVSGEGYIRTARVLEIYSDRIVLENNIGEDLLNAKIYPAFLVFVKDGINIRRNVNSINFGALTLQSILNFDYSSSLSYPTYRTYPVLLGCNPILSGISDTILQPMDLFDNGSSNPQFEYNIYDLSRTFTLNFTVNGNKERATLKKLIHTMKGRYKTFWIPSYHNDFVLSANIGLSDTTISVNAFGYGYYYRLGEPSDFVIEMNNGTYYYNRIIDSTKDIDTEVFTLQSAFGANILMANVKRIMFLHRVRFDSDTIQLRHLTGNVTQCSTVVREVSE